MSLSLDMGYALMMMLLGSGLVVMGVKAHLQHRPRGWCAGCVGMTTFGFVIVVAGLLMGAVAAGMFL